MTRINIAQFRKEILQDANGKLDKAAYTLANETFEDKKQELLDEFDNHIVTQEILAGPELEHSELIDDPNGDANLYSFIGFNEGEGEQEVETVRTILEQDVRLEKTPRKGQRWQFGVFLPPDKELEQVTPMPWGTSRSWLTAIERGISGIAHYVFRHNLEASRSGTGVQVKGNYRKEASFQRTGYVFKMLKDFAKSFK